MKLDLPNAMNDDTLNSFHSIMYFGLSYIVVLARNTETVNIEHTLKKLIHCTIVMDIHSTIRSFTDAQTIINEICETKHGTE